MTRMATWWDDLLVPVLLLAVTMNAGAAPLAECAPGVIAEPRPAWAAIDYVTPSTGLSAVGSAPIGADGVERALSLARTRAAEQVAGQISTKVVATSELVDVLKELDGTQAESSTFTQATKTATDVVLKGLQASGRWVDVNACTAWTLLELSRDEVVRIEREHLAESKVQMAETLLREADDPTVLFSKRMTSAQSAEKIIGYLGTDRPSERAILAGTLLRVRNAHEQLARQRQTTEKLVAEFQAQLSNTGSHPTAFDQKRAAVKGLLDVLDRPLSGDPEDPAYAAAFLLATHYKNENDGCAARSVLSKIIAGETAASLSARATSEMGTLSCDAETQFASALKRIFEGRPVSIACVVNIDQKIRPWSRACSELTRLGQANSAGGVAPNPGKDVVAINAGASCTNTCLEGLGKRGAPALVLIATGSVDVRARPSMPDQREYRFEGEVTALVVGARSVVVSDRYSVMSGWNPISAEAAIEVTALNALSRIRAGVARTN